MIFKQICSFSFLRKLDYENQVKESWSSLLILTFCESLWAIEQHSWEWNSWIHIIKPLTIAVWIRILNWGMCLCFQQRKLTVVHRLCTFSLTSQKYLSVVLLGSWLTLLYFYFDYIVYLKIMQFIWAVQVQTLLIDFSSLVIFIDLVEIDCKYLSIEIC